MSLDKTVTAATCEAFLDRLWRRYMLQAHKILDAIELDTSLLENAIDGTDFCQAEVVYTAQQEMVVTLEDFLRRRSKVALVSREEDLRKAEGLAQVSEVLFPGEGELKYQEYFG